MMINDNMKTLTIEHLAAYLPYGLRFQSGHYLIGLYGGGSDITRPLLLSETVSGPIDWEANMDMDKPLLRQLSQLTETIEHNGERVVPIIEVAKMFGIDIEKFDPDDDGVTYYGWTHQLMDDYDGYVFSYYKDGAFGIWNDEVSGSPLHIECSMSVIQKLHSWHFDTFGLIEAGLAIPIPSIPQP